MLSSFRGKVAKFIFICFVLMEVQMSIIINGIRAISGRRISPQKRIFQREVSNLLNQDINDISIKDFDDYIFSLINLIINLQIYEKKWNPMSSFSKKMVKNVFNDEVFNLVFVYFFFSVVCECV